MNRRKTASVWALVLGGVLLALPAAAQAQKEKPKTEAAPDTCAFDCDKKANSQVESCSSACPTSKDPGKREAGMKCMNKCAEKFHASTAACKSSCPTKKVAAPPAKP